MDMPCEYTGCSAPGIEGCKYCYQTFCSGHLIARKHSCHREPEETADPKAEDVKDYGKVIPEAESNEITPGAEEQVIDDIKELLGYTRILSKNTTNLIKKKTEDLAKGVIKLYPIELIDLEEKASVKSEFYNIKNYIEYYKKNTRSRKALQEFFDRIIALCDN